MRALGITLLVLVSAASQAAPPRGSRAWYESHFVCPETVHDGDEFLAFVGLYQRDHPSAEMPEAMSLWHAMLREHHCKVPAAR